jgi:hypothetical protein
VRGPSHTVGPDQHNSRDFGGIPDRLMGNPIAAVAWLTQLGARECEQAKDGGGLGDVVHDPWSAGKDLWGRLQVQAGIRPDVTP